MLATERLETGERSELMRCLDKHYKLTYQSLNKSISRGRWTMKDTKILSLLLKISLTKDVIRLGVDNKKTSDHDQ